MTSHCAVAPATPPPRAAPIDDPCGPLRSRRRLAECHAAADPAAPERAGRRPDQPEHDGYRRRRVAAMRDREQHATGQPADDASPSPAERRGCAPGDRQPSCRAQADAHQVERGPDAPRLPEQWDRVGTGHVPPGVAEQRTRVLVVRPLVEPPQGLGRAERVQPFGRVALLGLVFR